MALEFVSAVASLLQKCVAAAQSLSEVKNALRMTRRIHAAVIVADSPPQSPFLHNNFISAYGRCGARQTFDVMSQRSIVSYDALISAFSRDPADASSAIRLLPVMASAGLRPNSSTLSSLLQASSCLGDLILGSTLHACAVSCGFSSNLCVQTALLVMYSSCGSSEGSKRVFNEMENRDAVAWNSFIFARAKKADSLEGLQLFLTMLRTGVPPTGFTFSIAINACTKSGEQRAGEAIHAQIVKAGSPDDIRLQNSLLDMYANFRDLTSASSIFMENQGTGDLVSWNSMMAGFSDSDDADKTWDLFIQLRASPERIPPDEYTFAAVVSATAALPAVKFGKPLHSLIIESGVECSVFVGSTLLDMYFKNGEPASARNLFDGIPQKDAVLWTDMIVGHGWSCEAEAFPRLPLQDAG